VAGCAGGRAATGTLTPPGHRITDEAIAADARLFQSWSERLTPLEADTTPARAYQAAKARGWLAFAREEYTDNDRTPVVGDALAQAQQLIVAMERGDSSAGRATPLVARTARLHEDLWAEAERFKHDPGFRCAARDVARLEIELLRAGHETADGASCRAEPHYRTAEALIRDIRARIGRCRPAPQAPAPAVVAPIPAAPAPAPAPPPPTLPVRRGTRLVLHGVNFENGRATLLPEARAVLDVVAQSLVDNPEVRLEIAGHTDSRSPAEYNLWLSEERAKAVRDYLIERGVAADRLVAKGYGLSRPIAPNDSPAGRARNRRVELMRLQ
jgi:outer membrane protein OmpA-like peptidoglycan-associated protein